MLATGAEGLRPVKLLAHLEPTRIVEMVQTAGHYSSYSKPFVSIAGS